MALVCSNIISRIVPLMLRRKLLLAVHYGTGGENEGPDDNYVNNERNSSEERYRYLSW